MQPRARGCWGEPWPCHQILGALGLYARLLTSLGLRFPICKMGKYCLPFPGNVTLPKVPMCMEAFRKHTALRDKVKETMIACVGERDSGCARE